MAVMVNAPVLGPVMVRLHHPDLLWVIELDFQFEEPETDCYYPHWLTLSRRPILVYGKRAFQWSSDSDVIRLPSPYDPSIGGGTLWGDAAAMALVAQLFTQPDRVICDPFLMGRGGTAFGALSQGCEFIGADPYEENLESIRKFLIRAGLGGGHQHGTSPTMF